MLRKYYLFVFNYFSYKNNPNIFIKNLPIIHGYQTYVGCIVFGEIRTKKKHKN